MTKKFADFSALSVGNIKTEWVPFTRLQAIKAPYNLKRLESMFRLFADY